MKINFTIFIMCVFLYGCGDDDAAKKYDIGYDDGYAVGYNTACKIRSTLIEGDWDNEYYLRGYNQGYEDDKKSCKNNRN